jgi:hypothetical protein
MLKVHFKGQRHDLLKSYCEKEPASPVVDESCQLIDETGRSVGYIFKGWDTGSEVCATVQKMKYATTRRTDGMAQNNDVFGFMPRNAIRCNYCRPSRLSKINPKAWNVLMAYAGKISQFIKQTDEKVWQTNNDILSSQVKDCWRIKDSIFTSGIVNKNNHLRYHVDFGNFVGTWSAMLVYKRDVIGGNLHLPEFDATVKLDDGDLVIFKSSDYVHGVTPIIKTGPYAYRYSIVYYSLEQLNKCLDPKEEMEWYKKWATESFLNKNERLEKLKKSKP